MFKLSFDIRRIIGFEWDRWNLDKNWVKHNVSKDEAEQVFINLPVRIFDDDIHSGQEKRYGALGKTNEGRFLVVFFTVRNERIRVISVRDQGKKDRLIYTKVEKDYLRKKVN